MATYVRNTFLARAVVNITVDDVDIWRVRYQFPRTNVVIAGSHNALHNCFCDVNVHFPLFVECIFLIRYMNLYWIDDKSIFYANEYPIPKRAFESLGRES